MTDLAEARPYMPPDDPRIPTFASYEEEAAYWDTHDFETLEPVPPEELAERQVIGEVWAAGQRGRDPLTTQLTVRLDRATYEGVAAEARELGIRPATLIRIWLRERVRPRRSA